MSLLDARSIARILSGLIRKHDCIRIAVAWGGITPVAEVLLANRAKFNSLLLGVDFFATDPDLIDRLVDVPNAFVAKNRPGCFHPKIFYFESGNGAEAIIGSANLTSGGLGKNLEASVHVKGVVNEPFFEQVRNQLDRYKDLQLPITRPLADCYRRQLEASGASRAPNPALPNERKIWARLNSKLGVMPWVDFEKLARRDLSHFEARMKLIEETRKIFSKYASFAHLSAAEAKGVAGVLGDAEAERADLGGLDWGWFGSMGGAGTFAELVGSKNYKLTAALDGIPMREDVDKGHFDHFVDAFTAAFSNSARIARLAPATRLLAMKRPDVFVCVNGGNRYGLARALSFAPTTIRLENYWERVIKPIRQAPWYNSPRPSGQNAKLWEARVAMLDAIYYQKK